MFVGDGLAERSGVDADRRHIARPIEREQRKHQFGEAKGLLQMRVAGHDEGIDPDILVFPDPRGDGWGIADQCGAGAVTYQADASPEIGADLELVATAAEIFRLAVLAARVTHW